MRNKHDTLGGKRVLVSGGTTGIGKAIVLSLLSEGARVLTFGRDEMAVAAVMREADQFPGELFGMSAEAGSSEALERVFAKVDEKLGGLDILVCNTGVASESLDKASEEEWRYVVDVNLLSYMGCAKAAMARIKAGGAGGHLLFVGSISAEIKAPGESVYAATKAGVQALAETLRKEVADLGIKVTCIQPGLVSSDLHAASPAEQRAMVKNGQMLEPEDVAEAVAFSLTRSMSCDIVNLRIEPIKVNY